MERTLLMKLYHTHEKLYDIYPLFDILESCKGTTHSPEYHPEGDVFIHSLQVLSKAMRETRDLDLLMAAMLHDVGKRIDSKGHEDYAVQMLDGLISEKTAWLILNHMRVWYLILGEMRKRSKVMELYQHEWFPDLVMLARWDKMGRQPHWIPKYDRVKLIERLFVK